MTKTSLALACGLIAFSANAVAQVTPAEPFGGRPFGAAQAPASQTPPVPPAPVAMPAPPAPVMPAAPPPVPPRAQVPPPVALPAPAPVAPLALPAASPKSPVTGLPTDAPRLVISGGVYSSNPAQRMLIVNGLVVREGADLASGVVLQQVRPESAVLGFRGASYNVFF